MTEVDESLDYSIRTSSSPFHLYTKLSPIDGTNSITLNTSTGVTRTWQLPNSVFNLARTYWSMTITPASATAGYYNHLRVDFPTLFQNISLYSVDQGTELEVVNYVNHALNIINRYCTPEAEMKTFSRQVSPTATTAGVPFVVGFQSVNLTAYAAAPTAGNIGPGRNGAGNVLNIPEFSNYDTMRYFIAGNDDSATPVLDVKIPLSRFLYTLFSLDKDVYFNAITQLKVVFNAVGSLGQFSSSQDLPQLATAGFTSANGAITADVAITNMFLYVAEEKSSVHRDAIIRKTLSGGLRYLVNHLDVSQQSLTGSSQQLTYRYNRIMGSRLSLWFHSSLFNHSLLSQSSNATLYRRAYNDGVTIPWGQVSLDLDNSSLFRLLTPAEFYNQISGRLQRTCINSYQGWLQNWCVPMDWRGNQSLADNDPNVMAGLDLSQEKQIQIAYDGVSTGNSSDQRVHYAVGVIQRSIMVNKDGPVLVAM